jgi:hypothetical protein
VLKSPLTPLFQRGEQGLLFFKGGDKTSPFEKGGLRGILKKGESKARGRRGILKKETARRGAEGIYK